MIGTGVHIGEAVALTIEDVHLDKGGVIAFRSVKGRGRIGSTKSKRFRRVEIGPKLVATLTRVTEARRDADPRAPLFVTPPRDGRSGHERWAGGRVGGPLERSIVSGSWHKAALDAALRDMPLHSLRHTADAAWLATGYPRFYVQRQLGHSQITTTERIHAHLEERLRAARVPQIERPSPRGRVRA